MKKPLHQVFDYLILLIIISLGILSQIFFNGHRETQRISIIGLSCLYFLWGIYHHNREKTLHAKIAAEYALFAITGAILIWGLL